MDEIKQEADALGDAVRRAREALAHYGELSERDGQEDGPTSSDWQNADDVIREVLGDLVAALPVEEEAEPEPVEPVYVELKCDMGVCSGEVTHIGAKGYIYCADHAVIRRPRENTRKLRKWELDLLHEGKLVPSYEPRPKPTAAPVASEGAGE